MKNSNKSMKTEKQVMLHNLAELLFAVFSIKYDNEFKKLLLSGGGGNSMFINVWIKPSAHFVKMRISSQAKKILEKKGYTLDNLGENVPKSLIKNNAKGAANRIKKGKRLHIDHNPGNVLVLELICDKVQKLKHAKGTKSEKIKKLESFLEDIQYLDIITVEQDDIRTLADDNYSKKEKDKMTLRQRDKLLADKFDYLPQDLSQKIIKRFI